MKSVYIHIPFCYEICSYCDFCKQFYNEKRVDLYLDALEDEIKSNYKGELIETLYIGGGTPSSLTVKQLKKLFDIVKILNLSTNLEYTIECNIDVTLEKINLFKNNLVNRISIGIETINPKHLKLLNRYHTKDEIIKKINYFKKVGLDNINVDLIYALPNQTIEELSDDIDFIISLDVKHVSTYSLIIEPNTKLYIDKTEYIDDDLDFKMYKLINKKLKNYNHYEISNYAKLGYESKHNLVYWNNQYYYGFGMGASGYINNTRYDNTKSFKNYLNKKYTINTETLLIDDVIKYEIILGFRKINGINKQLFYEKYNINLETICSKLIEEKKLIDDGENIKISEKYIYLSNSILMELI